MKYLIAVDLEGVNLVTGEPEISFNDSKDYPVAVAEAEKELNTIISAICEAGADKVYVWDNHGQGNNLNFAKIDKRAVNVGLDDWGKRMSFAARYGFDGIILLGYHCKAGTQGVLSHSYSSKSIQYYKINGRQIGEVGIDMYIAASYSVQPVMIVGDDLCVKEAKELSQDIVAIVTKIAKGRHNAVFKSSEELHNELYEETIRAVKTPHAIVGLDFPAELEVKYTEAHIAKRVKDNIEALCGLAITCGAGNILNATISSIDELKLFL